MMPQFMASLSPNNRPQQQSSPSNNSMSTATPPHQTAPAHQNQRPWPPQSAALVMSYNSINNINNTNTNTTTNNNTANNQPQHPYIFSHSIPDMSCVNLSNATSHQQLPPPGPAPGYYHIHHPPPPKAPPTASVRTSGRNSSTGMSSSGHHQHHHHHHHHNQNHNHHHHHHHHQRGSNCSGQTSTSSTATTQKQPEFLPICDLLFNLISMIIYFCGLTFNIISLYALYHHPGMYNWALTGLIFVIISNIATQYNSFTRLYRSKLDECRRKQEAVEELEQEEGCDRNRFYRPQNIAREYPCGSCSWLPDRATELHLKFLISIAIDALTHLFCLGFLIRYIKLVIPVDDTARVKREARDLSLLRMIHAFIQSAPLLLLQAYLIYSPQTYQSTQITNLNITSAILSLLNISWTLASFTKYAREKYMHKFVLTWFGIFSQLLWRLGTISSRVVALTIYAVYYGYWMLVVLALHWLTMFFWLIKPGNLLRDEVNMPPTRKVSLAAAIGWIYCFCYINLEDQNSKLKTTSFYLIMFLENNLLLTVCLIFSPQVNSFKYLSTLVVYMGFVIGMLFMFLYYKYFHVNVLNNGLSCSQESIDSIADQLSPAGKKIAGFKPGTLRHKSDDVISQQGQRYQSNISVNLNYHHQTSSYPEMGTRTIKPPYLAHSQVPIPQSGVFNCKLGTEYRRQKIPSSRGV